ncbi:hypothetical protein BMS3Abin14_00955 [bacterium BMS3Abin14]|nr:hypothetical protein BMS3Abin14_00955 [bacterium BMS3Abin14]
MKAGRSAGFTLVEMVLSLAILAVAIPVLASLFAGGLRQPQWAREQTRALFLAQGLMEEIVTHKWDEAATPPGHTNVPSAIGLDAGEAAGDRSTWDDIDDYDGLTDNPMHDAVGTTLTGFAGFWSQTRVDYVASDQAAPDFETALGKGAGTDFKLINVTVNWPDGNVSLTAVRGNF